MRHFKQITALCLALAIGHIPVQAESVFTQFVNELKQKGKELLEDVANKAQESLENGRLFGLPNCTKATIQDALEYAVIVEASSYNDSREASLEGYSIIDFSTIGNSQASEETLFAFTETIDTEEDITLKSLSGKFIESLEHVAEKYPRTFLQHFFVDYDYQRHISSYTLEGFGVKARVYQPEGTNRLILTFRGTESDSKNYKGRQLINIGTDLWQAFGGCSMAYEFAYCLGLALSKGFPSYKVECTGISLGGGLAHYTAAMLGTKAVCFNDPNLGDCAILRIHDQLGGDTTYLEERITHIHIEGEILNTIMPIAPGKKLGAQCDVPPYHDGLDPVSRHYTDHLVSSLEEYLHSVGA